MADIFPPLSRAALLVPHLYVMGCTSGTPSLLNEIHFWWLVHHGIHFWWPVHHGLHFWCPISTWRDPLLVARSSWAALRGPSFMGFTYHEPILMDSASRGPTLVGFTYRGLSSWVPHLVELSSCVLHLVAQCFMGFTLSYVSFYFYLSYFYAIWHLIPYTSIYLL